VTRLSGPKIRTDLEKLMGSPNYDRWSTENKVKALERVIQGRHTEAKVKVVRSQ